MSGSEYGITDDDNCGIYVWNSPWAEPWFAIGVFRRGARKMDLFFQHDPRKVKVRFPRGIVGPRTEENRAVVDEAIIAALRKSLAKKPVREDPYILP